MRLSPSCVLVGPVIAAAAAGARVVTGTAAQRPARRERRDADVIRGLAGNDELLGGAAPTSSRAVPVATRSTPAPGNDLSRLSYDGARDSARADPGSTS